MPPRLDRVCEQEHNISYDTQPRESSYSESSDTQPREDRS
jgi:hypothetical protein